MAIFDEDLSPTAKPRALDAFSIDDLEERIATLTAEIERCRAMIAQKRASKAAAEFAFKSRDAGDAA